MIATEETTSGDVEAATDGSTAAVAEADLDGRRYTTINRKSEVATEEAADAATDEAAESPRLTVVGWWRHSNQSDED